jgi:iron complex outermembrane receptor protein
MRAAARRARRAPPHPPRGTGAGTPDGAGTGSGTGSGSGGIGVRQFNGIVGSSSTVITAEEIAHSPSNNLPDILGQVPGVQLTTLYGIPANGAKTSVDLRGFGAFATANTLILINGRRLNDIDMAQVDLSTIPLNSIERIEITRGNSGAVLYGDNAVGGVINIVTKTGVGGPPVAIRGEAGVGSFNTRSPTSPPRPITVRGRPRFTAMRSSRTVIAITTRSTRRMASAASTTPRPISRRS